MRREGGAYIVEVCPRTVFKFVVPTSGVDSIIPLVQGIPAYDWVSAILAVRVHAVTTWAASGFKVNATNMSLSEDDPSIVFTDTGSGAAIVTLSGAGTPPAQRVTVAQYTPPIGPMVQVGFSVPTATAGGTIEIALSIELVGRTA